MPLSPVRTHLSAHLPALLRRAAPSALLGAALAVAVATPLLPTPGPDPLRLVSTASAASPASTPSPASSPVTSEQPVAAQDAVAPSPVAVTPTVTRTVAPTVTPVRRQTVDSPIRFRTVRKADPRRYRGVEKVVRSGRTGVLRREYLVVGAAGTDVSRTVLSEERVRAPQDRVVAVGTKARPRYRTDLDWAALARCESGGNPRAVSRTGKYRGLYQFDLRTWRSVGGTGDPVAHDREEQTFRASRLHAQRGRSPWPHCGRHL